MNYIISDGSEIDIEAGDSVALVEGGPDLPNRSRLTVKSVSDGLITITTQNGDVDLSPSWVLSRIKNGGSVEAPPSLEDNINLMVSQAISAQLQAAINQVLSGSLNPEIVAQILQQQAGTAFKTISKTVLVEIFNKVIEAIEEVE